MTQFMITTRTSRGEPGKARYLTFELDADGEETDLGADPKRWLAKLVAGFDVARPDPSLVRNAAPRRTGEILFLVHGFNVSHQHAVDFHRQCANALALAGWKGQVVSYDWPSDGLAFAYLNDRSHARAAASTLVTSGIRLLEAAQQADCGVNIHVLAHSMGSFVVQQAFNWAYQDVPPDWKIGQIMLAAADVDYTVFKAGTVSADAFTRFAGRLTAYCNRYDKALMVSNTKRLELAPRMGRVGLPASAPPMMCQVDCSDYFEVAYPSLAQSLSPIDTHCFYFKAEPFWQDVALTLAGGIDRSVFPTRADTGAIDRFSLKVGGADEPQYRAALNRALQTPEAGAAQN